MTPGRKRPAVPRRGRRADGPDHAPALDRRPACPRKSPSRTARRCACSCSAKTSWCSATPRAASACSTNICPHRRASLLYARNEECGLRCLYHGWKFDVEGNVVEMASEPAESNIPQKREAQGLSGARGRRLRVVLHGPADEMPEFEPPAFAPTPDARVSRHEGAGALQLGADPRRPDRLGAFLEPAFVRHGAGAGRRREGDRHELAAALDRQGAALPDRAHQLRLPLRGDPPPDQERGDARLHPHDGLYRAVHRADSAEQHAQCRDAADAGGRHTPRSSISSPGTAPTSPASTPTRGASSTCCEWGIDVDADFNGIRTRENNYLQDRAAMKAGNFTGIAGIPNQDIAMWEGMGPISDRTQGAARRQRRRGGGVPPADGRGRADRARRRPGDRHHRARACRMRRSAPTKAWCRRPTNWRSLGGGSEAPRERVA